MPASYVLDVYISTMKPTLIVQIYNEWLMQIYLHVVQETPDFWTVTFDKNSVISRQANAFFS